MVGLAQSAVDVTVAVWKILVAKQSKEMLEWVIGWWIAKQTDVPSLPSPLKRVVQGQEEKQKGGGREPGL